MKNLLRVCLLVMLPFGAMAQSTVVDFDNPRPSGSAGSYLQGTYGGINWGNNSWRWTTPYASDNTNSIYFASGSGNSRTFTFASGPRVLNSIQVYALRAGILTLSDNTGQTTQQSISTGPMQTVATGWSTPSTTVTVAYTAGWDLGVDNIAYTEESTPPPQFTLSVSVQGDGSGDVTSQPAGINCGNDCSETYDQNTLVTLTASPAAGSQFDGWSGHADCTDGSVSMTADRSCVASFVIPPPPPPPPTQYSVTVSISGSGSGTVTSTPAGINCGSDCSENYAENTQVTLSATANSNSVFDGWSGDADCTDGVLNVTGNRSCTAQFSVAPPPPQYTLSVAMTGSGTGVVTSSPAGINCGTDCSELYNQGTEVALAGSPDTNSQFISWLGDADCADGTVTMNSNVSCVAEFQNTFSAAGKALRFFGSGAAARDRDRLKFLIDDYTTNSDDGFVLDVGLNDFTIELWMRALASENTAGSVSCGVNENWIRGNILVDRDRFNRPMKYGLSIAGGRLVFGVTGSNNQALTICGNTSVLDNNWHHVAIQRSVVDGQMTIYVDGVLDAIGQGPAGDISYPGNSVPGNFCGTGGNQPCIDSDPYLVIAAEKHDAGLQYPAFSGWLDEMRISDVIRYNGNFSRPSAPFVNDSGTLGLYHFDEGVGEVVRHDGHPGVGARDGVLRVGGTGGNIGPIWVTSDAPIGN